MQTGRKQSGHFYRQMSEAPTDDLSDDHSKLMLVVGLHITGKKYDFLTDIANVTWM